ncbi:tetratricopeptide repeat protein [Thermocrinis minervae]|nr:hypothetical protein [Thermocrinis minervae]
MLYYLIHTIPSILISLFSYSLLPKRYRKRKFAVLTAFFLVSWALGTFGLIIILVISLLISKLYFISRGFYRLDVVPFDYEWFAGELVIKPLGEGSLRRVISNGEGSLEDKLLALRIISKTTQEYDVLYKLLKDSSDVKLYAFQILSSKEKVFHERIKALQEDIKFNDSPEKRIELAELIVDMCKSGIVSTEIRPVYYKKALDVLEPIKDNTTDIRLYRVLGEVLKGLGDYSKAVYWLEKAYVLEPSVKLAFEIAELYYDMNDYRKVKETFQHLVQAIPYYRNHPMVRVWVDE